VTAKPLCQRTYRDGRPCQQDQRYALPGVLPSCWRHLTDDERQAVREQANAARAAGTEKYMSEGNVYLTWAVPARGDGWSDLDYLHAFQAGRCAWCGRDDQPLVRDHDHETLLLRGLLCDGCNKAEAVYGRHIRRSEIARPHAWDLYRRVPPAAMLDDVHIRHANDPRCRCGCSLGVNLPNLPTPVP
jgi:hypothetical protein